MMLGLVLAAAIGGPFPLLCTPYAEKGEVDCAVLAKETRFVADCGASGVIWPAADDALPLKTYSIIKPAPGDPDWAKTHSLTVMEYPRANVTIRVCSKGTQPCRHIRIDGTAGTISSSTRSRSMRVTSRQRM